MQTYGWDRQRWGPYRWQVVRWFGRTLEYVGQRIDSRSWGWKR